MRLATIRNEKGNSIFVVIGRDGLRGAQIPDTIAPSLEAALNNWETVLPELQKLSYLLDHKKSPQPLPYQEINLANVTFLAPLPKAPAFFGGSSFLSHVERVRRSRGSPLPPDLYRTPLMYQGRSDLLGGPHDDLFIRNLGDDLDVEGELAIVTTAVPQGIDEGEAWKYIALILMVNDVSLRRFSAAESASGFGFVRAKPGAILSPFALTPDELGTKFRLGRAHLSIECKINEVVLGKPSFGEMYFSFFELLAHAASTRPLLPGTIISSGTASNKDEKIGVACIAEKRALEVFASGQARFPYLTAGDIVSFDIQEAGKSVFGAIRQKVVES